MIVYAICRGSEIVTYGSKSDLQKIIDWMFNHPVLKIKPVIVNRGKVRLLTLDR